MSFVNSIAISGFNFRNTHGQGADSMAISGLRFETPWLWVGNCCPPRQEQVEKTVLSLCMASISSGEAFFPVWVSGCRLSAVTITSSLMGVCGLSHERVHMREHLCEVWGLKTLQNWGYGKFNACIG